jgi:ATP-dependent protease HslVU (ClpYQ) peptidase subunit
MSIMVVVKKDNVAVIAADTLMKYGPLKMPRIYHADGNQKIFQFRDSFVGTVGPSAHMDVLRTICQKHADDVCFDSREEIFETYVRIHPILKEEFFINPSADKDDAYESSQIDALIANPNGIFGMYSWRTAVEYDRFYAIGSGRDFAMGAMFTVYETESAEKIAEAGIRAAAEFDDASGWPMTLKRIELTPKTATKAVAR